MKKAAGFTLIELMIFIIVTSILASGILLAYVGALGKAPSILENTIATQAARQCAEWFLSQRRLNGYASVSGANCTNPLTIPAICTTPGGYSLNGSCTQTTLRGDTAYETITLTVAGPGSAKLTILFGEY